MTAEDPPGALPPGELPVGREASRVKVCFAWKGKSLESPRAVVTACLRTSL